MISKYKSRIISLDLLRGYLLSVIAIDHMFRFPNFLELFTGRGELWVSAAEGFFLISGVLVGITNRKRFKENPESVFRRCFKRAAILYLLTVILTVVSTYIAHLFPMESIKPGIWEGVNVLPPLVDIIALKYIYGWADFLPYYAVFMLISPFVIFLLDKRKTYTVLIISFLIWFFFRNNFYAAWQILFVVGITAGFYQEKMISYLKNISYKKLLVTSSVGILISAAINLLPFLIDIKNDIAPFFDKNTMGPGRLVFSIIFFATLFIIFTKNEDKINDKSKGYFKFLGQNSLLVYSLQAIVLLIADAVLPERANVFVNFFCTTAVLGIIYLLTKVIIPINKNLKLVLNKDLITSKGPNLIDQ